ncbi:PREDICTED: repulsive guidance molecule A [Myotis davidii]|uniref:repulsive guidance molecule A n=1 Tax=Myotis davidii TaxID=225400 RepID=UPI0003EC1643|nr:PREDICTED: repulsive guidance molecule A [Myotis davidii]
MGMGRGAGRSALGFWPTLAFLLCSFPDGILCLPLALAHHGASCPEEPSVAWLAALFAVDLAPSGRRGSWGRVSTLSAEVKEGGVGCRRRKSHAITWVWSSRCPMPNTCMLTSGRWVFRVCRVLAGNYPGPLINWIESEVLRLPAESSAAFAVSPSAGGAPVPLEAQEGQGQRWSYTDSDVRQTGPVVTASPQLTIIFKNFQECVDQKVYQAEMDELPAAFADGSKNGGDKHGANSLRITEKVSGQHVEIQAKYIGTTIVVRQVGRYLTFAVRMPEEVVHAVEDRDSQGPAAPDTFPYETAVAKCKERLPVEDLYYQACVFDLLTTGDVNFTLAAYYALEDVKMLHSDKDKLHLTGLSKPKIHGYHLQQNLATSVSFKSKI